LAELIFSLLGQLHIEHRRLGTITLSNRKTIGLLAYLLCESDHAHSREFLLGLLWPDLPTAAAQNNLRVIWAQLQKALGTNASDEQPHLIGDRLSLGFNPLSDYELDVTRFRALIEACRLHLVGLFRHLTQIGYGGDVVIEMSVKDQANTFRYLAEALDYLNAHCLATTDA
jgi:DNA-binding SARP family transcriptional activator